MKKLSLAIALLLAPMFAHAWPWSVDMVNQISVKPQESVDPANPGMNPFPKRSVPVPGTATSSIEVKDKDAAFQQIKNRSTWVVVCLGFIAFLVTVSPVLAMGWLGLN